MIGPIKISILESSSSIVQIKTAFSNHNQTQLSETLSFIFDSGTLFEAHLAIKLSNKFKFKSAR